MDIIKLKRNKKICVLVSFVIIIFLLSNQIYAKYNYQFILDAFSLNRDNSEITYQIEKSIGDDVYTNQDVILKIISNKVIAPVEGFELDTSRTILTKTVSSNETNNIILEDLSGNQKEVSYFISNIDKEPPQILGIKDGYVYNQNLTMQYADNVGIKDIQVERYFDNLVIQCAEDYYDTGMYHGIDIIGNKILIRVGQYPKGTVAYKYYLNNVLKATSENTEYLYTGLTNATTYTIKVEAIDKDGRVIQSSSKTVKTKCFTDFIAGKNGDTFNVTITGIDSRVNIGYCALWHEGTTTQKFSYPAMNSDRSISLSFNAYDVDGTKNSGYYYLHLQLVSNSDPSLNEVICMNIKFDGITYVKSGFPVINPNYLIHNGNYEITVTDLAGNQTIKNCKIAK